MNTKILFSAMLVMLLALAGCGQHEAETPEEQATAEASAGVADVAGVAGEPENQEAAAWEATLTELRAVETDEEKVPILKAFVENHPNDGNAAYALSGVIYYLGDDQEGMEEALRFTGTILHKATDPDVRREMALERLGLYGRLGETESLLTAVEELSGNTPVSFSENEKIIDAALECKAWELALKHAKIALANSSAAIFRADYPERTFTDDEVDAAVKRRKAFSMASMGWALAQLGQVDRALTVFEEGSGSVTRNYVGIPDSPLFSYWGRTLAEAGRNEEAMEMLAADAVLGGDVDAMDALHGAYVAMKGEAGFEDYLVLVREGLAVQVDDFTLNNYQGEPLTLSQLKGQVVLLGFWFPT